MCHKENQSLRWRTPFTDCCSCQKNKTRPY